MPLKNQAGLPNYSTSFHCLCTQTYSTTHIAYIIDTITGVATEVVGFEIGTHWLQPLVLSVTNGREVFVGATSLARIYFITIKNLADGLLRALRRLRGR